MSGMGSSALGSSSLLSKLRIVPSLLILEDRGLGGGVGGGEVGAVGGGVGRGLATPPGALLLLYTARISSFIFS